jgi:septum formation protein
VILLASRSPQRRALLAALGVEFRVVAPRADEGQDPLANARAKAREVAARSGVPQGGAVLGADTEVLLDGRTLGKPADAAAARRELSALAGRTHVVRSAVCLIMQRGEREAVDDALVTFRPLSEAAIDRYVATGEWRDRAGGYAIQGAGAALVERVEGDETTVVGLPVGRLAAILQELGMTAGERGP